MEKALRAKLWGIRWRGSINRLLESLGGSMLIAGAAAGLVVLAEKLFATGVISSHWLGILAGVGVLISLIRWRLSRPGWMTLAVELDERAGLRERTSSLLAFNGSVDPFAQAAVRESLGTIASVQPEKFFPLRIPSKLQYPLFLWGLVAAAWMLLPQGDLLGKKAQREEQARNEAQVQQAKKETQAAVNKVKELSEKLNQNLLTGLPEEPGKNLPAKEPQQAKQSALRQIADLQKRVQEARADPKFNGIEELQQKLRQLRSPESGSIRELTRQLAQGNFDKAAAALRDLQRKLMDKDLTPQQRAQLAKDLAELAAQLDKLAKQQWQLENELKKMGLKPEMARDLKELEEALKKLSMDPEQKKKLLAMARASQSACKSCSRLSEALGSAAGALGQGNKMDEAAGEAMAGAGQQLSSLEALSQQLALTNASLSDLKDSMEKLSEGTCPGCNGEGCSLCGGKGPWKEGFSQKKGMGMGGPGRGEGQVADVKPTDFKTEKKRAPGKSQGGPIIANWYIQDREVKGQSVKAFSEVTQTARQEAAQDIETQHIPKEYQDSVKKYFSQLHNTSQIPTTQKGN